MMHVAIRQRETEAVLFAHRCEAPGECIESAARGRVDLSGADLTGWNLAGADFRGAYMPGATLVGANLIGANGAGADLSKSLLVGANLANALLMGANLAGADLSGANLVGADLSAANLRGARLIGANLTGGKFGSADLSGADLTNANLMDADFVTVKGRSLVVTGFLPWTVEASPQGRSIRVGCKDLTVGEWRLLRPQEAEAWKKGGGQYLNRTEAIIALVEAFWAFTREGAA